MNVPARPSLPRGLSVLCDDTVRPELPLREKAAGLLAGGARGVQPRRKRTPPREALAAAREAGADCVGLGPDALLAGDLAERVRRLSAAFDRGAQGASLVGGDV